MKAKDKAAKAQAARNSKEATKTKDHKRFNSAIIARNKAEKLRVEIMRRREAERHAEMDN